MFKRFFIILSLSFLSLFASSEQTPVDLNSSHFFIGKSISMYKDTEAKLELNEVMKLPSNAFIPQDDDMFSCLFTSSTFWYTLELNNPTVTSLSRLMVFEAAWLDYIQINIYSPSQRLQVYEVGNTFTYNQRSLDHPLINQRHTFEPGTSRLYIKVKTRDPFVFAMSVLEEKVFLLDQIKKSRHIGLLYGILLAMLLYNLFLFFGIREPYYAYYVLFVIAFLMMNASYNGYTFKFLFADIPSVQNWMQSSTIYFFSLSALLFARSFLDLKQAHPKLDLSSRTLCYILLSVALLSALLGGYRSHVILSIVFSVIISTYIFTIALYSLRKGNRSALFFILGSFSGLIGTVVTALSVMGQIPYHDFTYKALDIGMIVDAVLLSLALAHRVKITNEEKLIAEKASKTDVLTGLMNRRAYYEISTNEVHRSGRYGGKLSLMLLDIDHFKEFNDNYGHDIGDTALEHFANLLIKMKRKDDYAFRLGGDEFLLLLPETEKDEAEHLAQRIQDEVKTHRIHLQELTLTMSTSYGVAQLEEDDISIKEAEKRADRALYKTKKSASHKS